MSDEHKHRITSVRPWQIPSIINLRAKGNLLGNHVSEICPSFLYLLSSNSSLDIFSKHSRVCTDGGRVVGYVGVDSQERMLAKRVVSLAGKTALRAYGLAAKKPKHCDFIDWRINECGREYEDPGIAGPWIHANVLSDYRGRCIGELLIASAENSLRDANIPYAFSAPVYDPKDPRSVKFWEKMGYESVGDPVCTGRFRSVVPDLEGVFMSKKL